MDVNLILSKTKKAVQDALYDMVPTLKNNISRRKYGLSMYDIEDFILKLEATDLIKGPVVDRDYPNEVLFVFKREIIPSVVFYVKVKERNNQIKILSCHEDEN